MNKYLQTCKQADLNEDHTNLHRFFDNDLSLVSEITCIFRQRYRAKKKSKALLPGHIQPLSLLSAYSQNIHLPHVNT